MTYAIMLTVDLTGQENSYASAKQLLTAIEAGYSIVSTAALEDKIYYVLTGDRPLNNLEDMVVA